MDWAFAIERHREPLLRIIAALFRLIGLTETDTVERVSRPLYRIMLCILRPAKSAVRRLIIVAARDLIVKPSPLRPAAPGLVIFGNGQGRRVSFQLFDPRKPFDAAHGRPARSSRSQPRIRFIDAAFDPRIYLFRQPQPAPAEPAPDEYDSVDDDTVNAVPLCLRLAAIRFALEDLPRQARRLARWRARPIEARRPQLSTPLRIGRPPGHRKRQTHEVDEILAECHWLARNVPEPDTS